MASVQHDIYTRGHLVHNVCQKMASSPCTGTHWPLVLSFTTRRRLPQREYFHHTVPVHVDLSNRALSQVGIFPRITIFHTTILRPKGL
jgi:hypothetical protein